MHIPSTGLPFSDSILICCIIGSNAEKLEIAEPSFAVEILGLSGVPNAGETFQVVKSDKEAREIASFRESKIKEDLTVKDTVFELMDSLSKKYC